MGKNKRVQEYAKELRNNLTSAEAVLWEMIKQKQIEGRKFRRQHSINNYILDFYCSTEKLGIELDGQGHYNAIQYENDRIREDILKQKGIKIIRFENKEIFTNPDYVILKIMQNFKK